jgi:hypothetical protein
MGIGFDGTNIKDWERRRDYTQAYAEAGQGVGFLDHDTPSVNDVAFESLFLFLGCFLYCTVLLWFFLFLFCDKYYRMDAAFRARARGELMVM